MRGRLQQSITLLALAALLVAVLPTGFGAKTAHASALVQSTSAEGQGSVSASLASPAAAGNLLVVACSGLDDIAFSAPSGFTTAFSQSTNPSQAFFYKIAGGGESSFSCNSSSYNNVSIQLLEFAGVHAYTTLDATGSASGSSTSPSSGTASTTHANDLLVAAIVSAGKDSGVTGWTDGFSQLETGHSTSGNPNSRIAYGSAYKNVSTTGNYSATASADNHDWRGQIVAFRAMAASPTLSGDIVDTTGNPVASPSVDMSPLASDFICQTSSGTLGISSERIRVANSTDSPNWSLTIAPTGGPTSSWTSGANSYKFNDPANGGCAGGQLTIGSSSSKVTPASGCSASGVSIGSGGAFQGTGSPIALASASTPAPIDCYWDFTGFNLTQKVPAEQASGDYLLNLTITVSAS